MVIDLSRSIHQVPFLNLTPFIKMKKKLLLFLFFITLISCKEYKDYDPENGRDYLHSSFGYGYSLAEEWNLLDNDHNKINIDSLKMKYDSEAKIIRVLMAVYDKNQIELSNNEVLVWYGQSTEDSLNPPILEQNKNIVNIINFIDKNKEYILYPTQNKHNYGWSISKAPFSDKYINISGDETIHVIKKETYLINKNSFIDCKTFTEYGIWGNIYDVIKFSRVKKQVRYYIEAENENNRKEILKLDSQYRSKIKK